jgi:hypothetical protein
MLRSRLLPVGLLALALAAGPALADPPPMGNTKMWPWNVGYTGPRQTAPPPATLTPPPGARRAPATLPPRWDGALLVTVAQPSPARTTAPLTVNLRSPEGEIRSFPVAGGPEAIQRREIIVRPGESASINVIGTAQAR